MRRFYRPAHFYINNPMQLRKLSFHCGMEIENVSRIIEVSIAVYPGRFVGVGYSAVVTGLTAQLLLLSSFMATANPYQVVIPALE